MPIKGDRKSHPGEWSKEVRDYNPRRYNDRKKNQIIIIQVKVSMVRFPKVQRFPLDIVVTQSHTNMY